MATPLDPDQLRERDLKQRAKEEAEAAAQHEREGVEARENALQAAVEKHLGQSGSAFTPDELAADLGPDPEAVLRALERGVKAGTVIESHGRYRAAQR